MIGVDQEQIDPNMSVKAKEVDKETKKRDVAAPTKAGSEDLSGEAIGGSKVVLEKVTSRVKNDDEKGSKLERDGDMDKREDGQEKKASEKSDGKKEEVKVTGNAYESDEKVVTEEENEISSDVDEDNLDDKAENEDDSKTAAQDPGYTEGAERKRALVSSTSSEEDPESPKASESPETAKVRQKKVTVQAKKRLKKEELKDKTTEDDGGLSTKSKESVKLEADDATTTGEQKTKGTDKKDEKEKSRKENAVSSQNEDKAESTKVAKEETRKRKPSESIDDLDGVDKDFELPKRLKQGISSEGKFEDGESEITGSSTAVKEAEEVEVISSFAKPRPMAKFADFVHSPKSADPCNISSIVEITRAHDLITSALPSSSVHSSQEDLSSIGGNESDLNGDRPVIDDCDKLRQDQAKSLSRAKALLAAAFSDAETDDDSADEAETTTTKSSSVPTLEQISGKDSDMS